MKTLLLLLFFITINCEANFIPWPDKQPAYSTQQSCLKNHVGKDCRKAPDNFDGDAIELIDEMVDDTTKPNFTKSQMEVCSDEPDCDTKHEAKICDDAEESPIKNYELMQSYCSKFLGYDQKMSGLKILVDNESIKAQKESEKAAAEQAEKDKWAANKIQVDIATLPELRLIVKDLLENK